MPPPTEHPWLIVVSLFALKEIISLHFPVLHTVTQDCSSTRTMEKVVLRLTEGIQFPRMWKHFLYEITCISLKLEVNSFEAIPSEQYGMRLNELFARKRSSEWKLTVYFKVLI
jgi:hypothetical protein